MKKGKAYDKLFKYVEKNYSDEGIEWGTDVETERIYTMRAILEDKTQRVISINLKNGKIVDREEQWYKY